MYYLEDHIKAIEGVKDMLPAKDVNTSGRHNVLVDKNEFQKIRSHLLLALEKWYNDFVEVDALPTEGYFPGPPRVKPIADDGISSGENSWMSMSNASFLSMDLSMVQTDDYFATSKVAHRTFSNAEIILPHTKAHQNINKSSEYDDAHQEAFSDITGTRTSTTDTAYKQAMESLQAAKDKELEETRAIIEEQRREIQKMKEMHQREIATQKLLVDEVRKQHAISQEQVDNKLYHIQQQMRLEMARMMEQLMHTNIHQSTHTLPNDTLTLHQSTTVKRPNANIEIPTTEQRTEKRLDCRKSPAKKQLTYQEVPTLQVDTAIQQDKTSVMDEDVNASSTN